MADLYELADRFHDQVADRERAASTEIVQAYGEAWQEIKARLDALTGLIEDRRKKGETISPGWLFQRDRLAGLLRGTDEQLREFAATADMAIVNAQAWAVENAQAHAAELVEASFGAGDRPPGVAVSFRTLPKGALNELVGFTGAGTPVREVLDALAPSAVEKVRSGLIRGLATGQAPRKIAAGIREELGGDLTSALRISRTEVLRSYRESSRRGYEANPDVVERWRWTASRSARTCAMCLAMDGQEFPTSERMGTHPNCRCTMVPVVPSLAELLGDPSLPDDRPTQDTGPEWFAKQPSSLQEQVLGPAKFALYRNGKLELPDLVGYRDDPKWGPVRWELPLRDVTPPPPGTARVPDVVQQVYPHLVGALGDKLRIDDIHEPFVRAHVNDLSLLPKAVYEKLEQAGLNDLHVGNARVPDLDDNAYLRKQTPRGWSPGSTWDDVPGAYNPTKKSVAIGEGPHGSASVAVHEVGHALGDLLGYDHHAELVAAHQRLHASLNPYQQQGGPGRLAGRQEMLAEGLAVLVKSGRAAAIAEYDAGFVQFLEDVVLK